MGVAKKIASMDTASVAEPLGSDESQEIATSQAPSPTDAWWRPIVQSPLFVPALAVSAALIYLFWFIISKSLRLWMDDSGYYTHGFLVPLIAGYVVVRKWDSIKTVQVNKGWSSDPIFTPFTALRKYDGSVEARPVKPGYWALLPLVMLGYLAYVTTHTKIYEATSLAFLASILVGIWFVAGARWMFALLFPVLYLSFALPLFTGAINFYTNPAQIWSTNAAYEILKILGFEPLRLPSDPTTLMLAHFNLDVAVPCSGLKLLLAVTAFTGFFMMIGNLKWWGNLAMFFLIFPLCVFVNGLRIALIGMVGNTWGEAAGHQFHDYSGYITLLVCFFILFKVARGLGWKD